MPSGPKISRGQERAIAALLSEGTIENAAARAKISPRTLAYWLKLPAFAAAYRAARREVVEQAVAVLQKATIHAVAALVRNLRLGKPGVEVAAANSLLDKSLQAMESFDIVSRLEALEQQAAQKGATRAAYNGTAPNGQDRGGLGH
jgi:hypothetical protein